jgi:hypothetical protein
VTVAEDKVPQAGEQATPFAVRLQVTPLLLESFCTAAVNETLAAPAWTEVILFVIETVILLPLLPLPAPAPHPASETTVSKSGHKAVLHEVFAAARQRCERIRLLQDSGR